MTISPVEASHEMIQKTGLTISHSALCFIQAASDKPAYLLLTITQQLVGTPITFTMAGDTAYFQLATDGHPYYKSTLTVVSPAQKFHVHIRYAADKRGLHREQLTIQTPYESKTVSLEGRRKGWLPSWSGTNTNTSQPRQESPLSVGQSRNWIWLVMLAGISGLGYVSYTHKCQLVPGLCHDAAPATIVTRASSPIPDKRAVPSSSPKSKPKTMHRSEKAQANVTNVIDSLSQLRHSLPVSKAVTEPDRATVASKEQSATTRATDRRQETIKKASGKPEERTQPKPALTSEESELEKALNKPL